MNGSQDPARPLRGDAAAEACSHAEIGTRHPLWLSRLAKYVSGVLSPFLTAPAIFALPVLRYGRELPSRIFSLGVMVGTGSVLPFIALAWAVRKGRVSDLHLGELASRPRHMGLCLASVLMGILILMISKAPAPVTAYYGGYGLTIAVAAVISLAYKISGHCIALGGIAAGLLLEAPQWAPLAVLALLVVGWARVWRRRHTVLQCVLGGLCGFLCIGGCAALAKSVLGF